MNMFVVLEGIDGVGKTTLGKALVEQLDDAVFMESLTRTSELDKYIRKGYPNIHDNNAIVRSMLMACSRQEKKFAILRSLMTHKYLVMDRWWYSTYAYMMDYVKKGVISMEWLESLNKEMRGPDLVLYLKPFRKLPDDNPYMLGVLDTYRKMRDEKDNWITIGDVLDTPVSHIADIIRREERALKNE